MSDCSSRAAEALDDSWRDHQPISTEIVRITYGFMMCSIKQVLCQIQTN